MRVASYSAESSGRLVKNRSVNKCFEEQIKILKVSIFAFFELLNSLLAKLYQKLVGGLIMSNARFEHRTIKSLRKSFFSASPLE